MRYILMCGGDYGAWKTPRHLSVVCGEELVARTIRLLKENGVTDIAISSNNPVFEKFGVPVLKHDNLYIANGFRHVTGDWFNAFYPMEEPACYLFGDVFFSPNAIKIIVETETDDIQLFGSQPPFSEFYIKTHEEPFALKVANQKHLHDAIKKTRELDKQNKFWRKPIVWELFTVIKDAPLQVKKDEYTTDYVVINDYTCDVDFKEDIRKLNLMLGGIKMVKCEVIEKITFGKFNEIKESLIRKDNNFNEEGYLYVGDTFICDEDIAKYLAGDNPKNMVAVKVVEVIPSIYEAKVVDAEKVEVKVIIDEKKVKEEVISTKKPKKRNNKKNK